LAGVIGTGTSTVLSSTRRTSKSNVNVIKVVLSDGTSVSHGSPSSAVTAVDALFPDNVLES